MSGRRLIVFFLSFLICNPAFAQWVPPPSGGGGGSGTVTNFSAPAISWPSWLVPSVATGSTTPVLTVAAGAIPLSQLAQGGATTGQVIEWNGTAWAPATGSGGGVSSVSADSSASITVSPNTGAVLIGLNGAGTAGNNKFYGTNSSGTFGFYPTAVNAGTTGQLASYVSSSTIGGNANATMVNGILTLGQAGSVVGGLLLSGNTSGTIGLQAPATAPGYVLNMPSTTPTVGYNLGVISGSGPYQLGFIAPATSSSGSNDICDYRLSLVSNTPVTTADEVGIGNLYMTPYKGYHIQTYDSGTWTDHTPGQLSIAAPAFAHRIYDASCLNGSTLELTPWDASPVTATVTAATAASPCVLTVSSATGLSTGQTVFVDGITGSMGTTNPGGVNNAAFTITVSGTSVTLNGSNTTGLTYTSGGNLYVVPSTRNTALTIQNGVPLISSDSSRLVGTVMTTQASQFEDSAARRLVCNYAKPIPRALSTARAQFQPSESWSVNYTTAGLSQAANNGDVSQYSRVAVISCLAEDAITLNYSMPWDDSTAAIGEGGVGIGFNSAVNPSGTTVLNGTSGAFQQDQISHAALSQPPAIGYNYYQCLDILNSPGGTGTINYGYNYPNANQALNMVGWTRQ